MARLVVGVALAIVLGAVVTGVWLPRGASAYVMYWSRSQSNTLARVELCQRPRQRRPHRRQVTCDRNRDVP